MSTPANRGLSGTGYKQITLPRLDQRQNQLFDVVSKGLGPHLAGTIEGIGDLASGNPEAFEQLEAPAWRDYGKALGATGARFSGLGMGAQNSSAFQNALSGQAGELAERLQGQRLGLQQNAASQLFNLFNQLMGTQTSENALVPKNKPWWQELFTSLAPGLTQAGTQFGGTAGLMKLFPQLFGM